MRFCLTCVLVCVAVLPAVCQPPESCTGTVTDDRGNGVAAIDIAGFWLAGSHTPRRISGLWRHEE